MYKTRQPFPPRVRSAALGALAALLASSGAVAQDRFEIQVYDSEVAGAGAPGLELHANASRHRNGVRDDSPNQLLRVTLEPHLGVFGWGELGGYLQGALRSGGSIDFAGAKLRFKARWPEKLWGGLGLAVNFELSAIPRRYEESVWGSEVRPILDLRAGPLYLALNPILATDLAGPLAGHPQLEPGAKAAFFLGEQLSLGVEYYAGLGPLDAFLEAGGQSHKLFAVVDFSGPVFALNAGVGRGFAAAEPWEVKAIFGLHPREAAPAPK